MLKKSKKRFISLLMVVSMIMTMIPFSAFANETTASDLDGHWAEKVITEWMDYGVIKGYEDGTVRPNNSITRAEMTAMLDRVMDYQTKADNTFSDLQDTWYTDVILKANAAGVIGGYPDGTVKPDATITRQEAVAMFSRVLSLDTENAPEASFTDNADVADWAKDAVNAMAAKGYIHGSDGQFRPNDGITRAEVITIFNNIFADLYQASGEYTGDVNGSAVVSTDDVTLKDMTITGDLIIAEGVGDGHVVLDNVTVDGQLIVRGGGENSVIIKGDSKIDTISVERIDGAVRIAVEGNANVETVLIDNGVEDVKIEGRVDTVNVASANVNVDITGAAKDINVADTAKNATITVTSTATADNVSTSAENTTIIVAGTVSNIDIAVTANNSVVTTQSSATIDKVTTAAGNTTIEGSGTVTDVVVSESASDATVTTEGTKVENNSSSNVTTSDDSVIAPGTTDTTPGGTTETPSVPSVPSVPSGPSHTHNYVDGVCAADGAIDPAWAQVNSTESWNAAIEAGKNIVVTADFTTDAQLQITKAITVNGNVHTITAGTWTDANTTSKGDAHLVSINAGDNAVIIKNITLTGAKHIGDNNASGLNVYLSSNVTLDKVTLKDNEAAGMIVNGSTVTANGLTTSGNGWGGVNVDKGSNVDTTTSFTFDAASTFNDKTGVAVYSDAGNVTVNAPEGWACTQVSDKYVWAKLFEGGDGSEEKPYLISNMDQWNNIAYVATQGKSFLLNTDITLTSTTGMLNHFNGTLDGGNHSITLPNQVTNSTYWCAFAEYMTGTLKNIVINHGTDGIIPFIGSSYGKSLTFDNVNIGTPGTKTVCQTSTDDNNESAYLTFNESEELHFINCNNYLSYNYVGGASMYTSAFMGGYTVGGKASTITFDNCWNYGSLMMSNASLFIGNGTQMQNTTVIVTNSGNYGKIIGYQSAKPFCAISTDKFENNDAKKIALNTTDYNKEQGSIITLEPLTGFSATCTDEGSITIIAPNDSNSVAHYNLTYAAYGSNENGTYLFNVVIPIDKDQLATSYKKYTMISTDTAKEQQIDYTNADFISTGSYDMKYAIKDEYIICDFGSYAGGKTVKLNNEKPSITVTAVDSNETVLGLTSVQ